MIRKIFLNHSDLNSFLYAQHVTQDDRTFVETGAKAAAEVIRAKRAVKTFIFLNKL